MEARKVLEKAQDLYNQGQWQEAINVIDKNSAVLVTDSDIAEASRIKGWSYYYLGIKGPEERKKANLLLAEGAFKTALGKTEEDETKISVMNGLPLVIWILGRKPEAWHISDEAIKEFPDIPSIWNTRSILCRWAQDYEKSIEACEKVYATAVQKGDYRTAGHGKHNKADALVKLGRTKEAKEEYEKAIELYKKYEEVTGKSAKFHIEGVQKKLTNL
jgi:tetratricopeptide (TPR) repeat protein